MGQRRKIDSKKLKIALGTTVLIGTGGTPRPRLQDCLAYFLIGMMPATLKEIEDNLSKATVLWIS